MTDLVTVEIKDDIATLTIDDGKANALALAMSQAINAGLDRAAKEAKVVVLRGRPGILSAGFDLKLIQGNDDEAREAMRAAGFALFNRLFLLPQPLVVACTGHAVAGGAFLLLTSDMRIGTLGDYRIGLNEVAIGRPMPSAGVELTRSRLSPTAITEALVLAKLYNPTEAAQVGYLDKAISPENFDTEVTAAAQALVDLDPAAFAETKRRLRQPILDRIATD